MRILDEITYKIGEWRGKRYTEQCKSKYPDYEDNQYNCGSLKHIWGVTSRDNLIGDKSSFYTMNDIDITYDRDTEKYSIGIETIYSFPNDDYGPTEYMHRLLNHFTEWMESEGKDTNYALNLYDIFTNGVNINSKFESIEKMYAVFKFLVTGFCTGNSQ